MQRRPDTISNTDSSPADRSFLEGDGVSLVELERLCDGDLSAPDSERVEEAVRRDPTLSRRVQAIRELDGLVLRAMIGTDDVVPTSARVTSLWKAVAMCAILCTLVAWFGLGSHRSANQPGDRAGSGAPEQLAVDGRTAGDPSVPFAEPAESRPVRVVFAIALDDRSESAQVDSTLPQAASSEDESQIVTEEGGTASVASLPAPIDVRSMAEAERTVAIETLDAALHKSDFVMGAEVIARADERTRDLLFVHVGRALHSSQSVSRFLDHLPGEVAVDLCSAWLRDGTQRPAAIKHLGRRAQDAALRDRVHIALRGLLEQQPSLRAWMVSYANWAIREEPPRKDKTGAGRGARDMDELQMAAGTQSPGSHRG